MRPTESFDKRTIYNRKTFPKSGRVRDTKNGINRNADMKRGSRKAGFRSNFELGIAKKLSSKKIPYEYESLRLTYVPKPRTYTPDFHLTKQNIIIEAKGYFDKGDRVKMLLIKEQHPDLDIRIVFLNARNKIYKGSKTTYGAWAEKNGFKWAEGSIPEEWLKDDND